jgi:type I restriction enzyme, S subunit
VRYRPYPIYNGTRWRETGAIPTHWEARRLKFAVSLRNDKVEAEATDLEYMGLEHIESSTGRRVEDEAAHSEGIATRFEPGDVLFGKLRPYLAKAFLADKEGIATTEVLVMVSEEVLVPAFLKYLFLSDKFVDAVSGSTYGAKMPRANWDTIGGLPIQFPPRAEQERIAAFLDWKTAQIDALIAKKKELIEKLKEKRLAVITQAVTEGIDPDAPLRGAGVIWLERVPKHWDVLRFGYRTQVQEGQVDPEFEPHSSMLMIAPNHIESNTGRLTNVTSAHDQGAISGKYLVRKGDVVYSKIRPHLNKCAIAQFDGLCSADMYPIRTDAGLSAEFLRYWMLAQPFLHYATESSMRVAMPKLNRDTLSAAPLVVPPEAEQVQITAHLDRVTEKIDRMLESTDQAVTRLTEYRTALITAATTGQIDVRQVAIPPQA